MINKRTLCTIMVIVAWLERLRALVDSNDFFPRQREKTPLAVGFFPADFQALHTQNSAAGSIRVTQGCRATRDLYGFLPSRPRNFPSR